MIKNKEGLGFVPGEEMQGISESHQENKINEVTEVSESNLRKEAIKNLDITSFLAIASKSLNQKIEISEEMQAYLKYSMQSLIVNPTKDNVIQLVKQIDELRGEGVESHEVNIVAELIATNIIESAAKIHDEESKLPVPNHDEIDGFIKERTDLLNQLADEGVSSEALKSKSNQELKFILAQKNLNS